MMMTKVQHLLKVSIQYIPLSNLTHLLMSLLNLMSQIRKRNILKRIFIRIEEECEPEDKELLNEKKCLRAIHQDRYTVRDGTIMGDSCSTKT